jgi:hypothetical protein
MYIDIVTHITYNTITQYNPMDIDTVTHITYNTITQYTQYCDC